MEVIDANSGKGDGIYTSVDNVAIAYGLVVENAFGGAGNDELIGNSEDNLFKAGAGTNSID